MDVIKFRVWCKDKNEWEKDLIMLTPNGGILHKDHNGFTMPCKPETHIVQLFTGLLDKNGKEIFEGDVVNGRCRKDSQGGIAVFRNALVKWDDNYGGFEIDSAVNAISDNLGECRELEIIGNVFENPELLKEL
jgi:uncharacterized phage protein (TIGR01671 family)